MAHQDDRWLLETPDGQLPGRMARSWSPPPGLGFIRGEIGAIIRWRKTDSGEEYRDTLRREAPCMASLCRPAHMRRQKRLAG